MTPPRQASDPPLSLTSPSPTSPSPTSPSSATLPPSSSDTPSAVLITGTVGAGKTTVAEAIGDLLTTRGVPHAVIDLDWLRRAWPSPADDPFHHRLTVRNLRAVSTHFLEAGVQRLILAGVVESRAERDDYETALGVPLTVYRLRLTPEAVRTRLRRRHSHDPNGLEWHLQRATELDRILTTAAIEDVVVDNTGLTVLETAHRITPW